MAEARSIIVISSSSDDDLGLIPDSRQNTIKKTSEKTSFKGKVKRMNGKTPKKLVPSIFNLHDDLSPPRAKKQSDLNTPSKNKLQHEKKRPANIFKIKETRDYDFEYAFGLNANNKDGSVKSKTGEIKTSIPKKAIGNQTDVEKTTNAIRKIKKIANRNNKILEAAVSRAPHGESTTATSEDEKDGEITSANTLLRELTTKINTKGDNSVVHLAKMTDHISVRNSVGANAMLDDNSTSDQPIRKIIEASKHNPKEIDVFDFGSLTITGLTSPEPSSSNTEATSTVKEANTTLDFALECECCYFPHDFEYMVQCRKGHLFCCYCLERYAKESIYGQGKVELICMTENCSSPFLRSQIQHALPDDLIAKFDERVQEEAINMAGFSDFYRCKECNVGAILDPELKYFKCPNTESRKVFCKFCKVDYKDHIGLKCNEIEKEEETDLRKNYEEKMSEAKIRTCHACKSKYTKEPNTCNKITCRCQRTMCYICRTPDITYKHFCQDVRDPGKPCNKCNKCFLWSNADEDDELAINEMKNEARKARAEKGFSDLKAIGAPKENVVNFPARMQRAIILPINPLNNIAPQNARHVENELPEHRYHQAVAPILMQLPEQNGLIINNRIEVNDQDPQEQNIELPRLEVPNLDIELPRLEVPNQDIEFPRLEVPNQDIELPRLEVPNHDIQQLQPANPLLHQPLPPNPARMRPLNRARPRFPHNPVRRHLRMPNPVHPQPRPLMPAPPHIRAQPPQLGAPNAPRPQRRVLNANRNLLLPLWRY